MDFRANRQRRQRQLLATVDERAIEAGSSEREEQARVRHISGECRTCFVSLFNQYKAGDATSSTSPDLSLDDTQQPHAHTVAGKTAKQLKKQLLAHLTSLRRGGSSITSQSGYALKRTQENGA